MAPFSGVGDRKLKINFQLSKLCSKMSFSIGMESYLGHARVVEGGGESATVELLFTRRWL
jgi:hypothetical protein